MVARPDEYYLDTAKHEGVVSHLYKDTKGLLTVGIGFYIPNEQALSQYKWEPGLSEAVADYRSLKGLPNGRPSQFYKPYTHAIMGLDAIMESFDSKALKLIKAIELMWHFGSQPLPVRRVLFDLAWQTGATGLARFRKLHTAVMRQDWATAAQECTVSVASISRNQWRQQQFLGLL